MNFLRGVFYICMGASTVFGLVAFSAGRTLTGWLLLSMVVSGLVMDRMIRSNRYLLAIMLLLVLTSMAAAYAAIF